MKGSYIKIDANKLRAEMKLRNLSSSKVSAEMGYGNYFLTKSINLGRLGLPAVVLLERMYNIKREDYEIVPAPEPAPEPEPAPAPEPEPAPNTFVRLTQTDRRLWQMTADDLYRIINAAAYAAFAAALKEHQPRTPD